MGRVILTLVLFMLVALLAGLVLIFSGAYNVAATESHTGLFRWILATATEQSIAKHAGEEPSIDLPSDSTTLWRGFYAFEDMCTQCHGAPGVDRGWLGQGVTPTPPLLHEKAVEMNDAELIWVIRHGIKFTSMPALEPTHTDKQIEELAAFVRALPDIEATEYAARREVIENASVGDDSTSASDGLVHDDGHDHVH